MVGRLQMGRMDNMPQHFQQDTMVESAVQEELEQLASCLQQEFLQQEQVVVVEPQVPVLLEELEGAVAEETAVAQQGLQE